MSWFIPVLLAWPASDRIEVIPQPDTPVAASARVLAMAQQVEFRRVDARPDPEHAEDGGEQVVVAGRLACNVPHAIQLETLLACEAGRAPHHNRHLPLLAGRAGARHAMQVQAVLAQRLAVVGHVDRSE